MLTTVNDGAMFANEHNMEYVRNDDLANDTPNDGLLRVNDTIA